MRKIIPKREWKILKYEIFENKPLKSPFPKDVVKRRELLLLAQCLLPEFEFARSKEDREHFGAIYQKIMEAYFAWRQV